MNNIEIKLKEKLRSVSDKDIKLESSEAEIYNISTADILSIEEQIIESEDKNGD